MKKYLVSIKLLLSSLLLSGLLLSGGKLAQAKSDIRLASSDVSRTILVFGDSLSAAYNINLEQGWVSLLQKFVDEQNINVKIVNASISGETTSGGVERIKAQLALHQPDIIILELGGNDGLRGFDLAITKENLNRMVAMSIDHSSRVLLAGIQIPPNYGKTYTRRFKAIYTELAKKEQVELIPFILEKVATIPDYMQDDGIHPNAAGQPLIMQTVWQYLAPMLNESSTLISQGKKPT